MNKNVTIMIPENTENTDRKVFWGKTRIYFSLLGVFVAVFLFTFLTQRFKNNDTAEAANLGGFDAGYIISDWQMSNYNSMSEADIQNFLTRMNPCGNRDYGLYVDQTNRYGGSGYKWHWEGDHFVCLSQERFNGVEVGSGETAAHIIWQTAQDYRINPQVLIVLLEKENGLITDTFPHNNQYRTATGFGCPDTAACDSQYFGFKNQLRQAAALFRTVLDGGWSNYPVGNNYVQYHPNGACGGSVINIRNRATSALYRYTPYQPNWAALNWTSDGCSSYGNRNFYSYFEDWFGGITREASYVAMEEPRYMITMHDVDRIKASGAYFDRIEAGRMLKFTSKTTVPGGEVCLRTEFGTIHNEDACIRMNQLENVELNPKGITEENVEKIIRPGAQKIRIRGEQVDHTFEEEMVRNMPLTVEFNNQKYYITEYDRDSTNSEYGFKAEDVRNAPEYETFDKISAVTFSNGNADRLNLESLAYENTLTKGNTYTFASTSTVNGEKYYRTEHNTINKVFWGIKESDLEKAIFVDFLEPGDFIMKNGAKKINPVTGEVDNILPEGVRLRFTTKVLINGVWYYRSEYDSNTHAMLVVNSNELIDARFE